MAANRELVDDIFEDSDKEEFAGFSREELGIHSKLEVEEYDEDDNLDGAVKEIHNEVAAQVVDQEWTRTLTATNIPPFSVENPGPTNILDENQTELNFFELLLTDEVYKILLRETNLYAKQKVAVKPDPKWRDVGKDEMKAYCTLEFCVYMSVVKLPETQTYWAKDFLFGSFRIATIMPRDRFYKILQYFHENDLSVMLLNAQRKPVDKLYLVRPVLDVILRQIEVTYVSYQDLSIDEAMIAFRECLRFRQYLPAKPTKYSVKVWEACNTRNGYCFDSNVHLGLPSSPGGAEAREVRLGQQTVLKLTEKLRDKNYHVYFDNYFASIRTIIRGASQERNFWLWNNAKQS